jgi:hypothetical protein
MELRCHLSVIVFGAVCCEFSFKFQNISNSFISLEILPEVPKNDLEAKPEMPFLTHVCFYKVIFFRSFSYFCILQSQSIKGAQNIEKNVF